MSEPLTSDEKREAQRRIEYMQGLLNETLEMMEKCPYPEELSRVSSVMGMLQGFEPVHYTLMAAVAIDRLSRLSQQLDGVIGDVEGGENFFIELTAGLIMTPSWVKDEDRVAKVQSIARAVFSECSKEQLALLTAIGMMRLTEGGLGPKA